MAIHIPWWPETACWLHHGSKFTERPWLKGMKLRVKKEDNICPWTSGLNIDAYRCVCMYANVCSHCGPHNEGANLLFDWYYFESTPFTSSFVSLYTHFLVYFSQNFIHFIDIWNRHVISLVISLDDSLIYEVLLWYNSDMEVIDLKIPTKKQKGEDKEILK